MVLAFLVLQLVVLEQKLDLELVLQGQLGLVHLELVEQLGRQQGQQQGRVLVLEQLREVEELAFLPLVVELELEEDLSLGQLEMLLEH